MGLIHMNARLYDPEIGRFIQADSMVEPEATQGLNRYSYVLNNPLTFTDPTGQLSFRQVVGLVVGIAFSVWSGQLWAINNLWGSFAAAVGGGFASSVIATGSLKAGLWGAVSAAAFWGIGTAFSKTYAVAKEGSTNMVEVVFRREASGSAVARIAAHAGAGGALADLQGGNFGSGFLSAGVTKWLSPAVSSIGMGDGERSFVDLAAQTVASATIGGTASAITGNGFGSGAQTAAFQYLFNQVVTQTLAERAYAIFGKGPPSLGQKGVESVIERYRAQGLPIIDVEVRATLPDTAYSRRYDFVTRSATGAFIGVEVKSTERGLLRLDRYQVNFDTALLSRPEGAAVIGAGYRITGVAYEGVDFTSAYNARWQEGYLYFRLQSMHVRPALTPAPK